MKREDRKKQQHSRERQCRAVTPAYSSCQDPALSVAEAVRRRSIPELLSGALWIPSVSGGVIVCNARRPACAPLQRKCSHASVCGCLLCRRSSLEREAASGNWSKSARWIRSSVRGEACRAHRAGKGRDCRFAGVWQIRGEDAVAGADRGVDAGGGSAHDRCSGSLEAVPFPLPVTSTGALARPELPYIPCTAGLCTVRNEQWRQ